MAPEERVRASAPPNGNRLAVVYGSATAAHGGFRLSYLIGRLDDALRRELVHLLARHGLTIPKYTAMSVLRNRPGLSNAQLARRSFVTPQAMNEVIAGLEQAGLVRREADSHHRRVRRTTITARGQRIFTRVDGEVSELEERMLTGVDEADRARFLAVAMECVHGLGAGLPES